MTAKQVWRVGVALGAVACLGKDATLGDTGVSLVVDGAPDTGVGTGAGTGTGTGTGSTGVAAALVFAPSASLGPDRIDVQLAQLGDLDGDGSLDLVHVEDRSRIAWHRGSGGGAFVAEDSASINAVLSALSLEVGERLGRVEPTVPQFVTSLLPAPAAGGDGLVVSWTVANDAAETGAGTALILPDGAGGHVGELLGVSLLSVAGVPLADLDGDGAAEVLVDQDGELLLAWAGDAARLEVLGALTTSAYYPQAWTRDVEGDRGLVYFANWGFGVTEVWTWSADAGLVRSADGFYAPRAWASTPVGTVATDLALLSDDELLWVTPPGALDVLTHPDLDGASLMVCGNFDGSGGMTALVGPDLALQVIDGALEPIPLTLEALEHGTLVGDVNGDGLDDLIALTSDGTLRWWRNDSAR